MVSYNFNTMKGHPAQNGGKGKVVNPNKLQNIANHASLKPVHGQTSVNKAKKK